MSFQESRFFRWLDERYGISKAVDFARHKTVPVHRGSVWYYFGGVSLFLFMVQVASGILLLLYYRVGAESSYESVRFIITKVPFGWLIRSIHSWGANLMVLAAVIHMFSVFFERAYIKPREFTWITGFVLLGLAMGFGFSGYLLPWNQLAFFATKVGTDIVGVLPVGGKFMLKLLRGSEDVTGATLSRFFGLHVAVFPLLFTVILSIHLAFVQIQGMSSPHDVKIKRPPMPFFPNFFLRDVLLWLLVLNLLALLAVFFPWELGQKADPFAAAPAGIKPEWYFLGTYQLLKLIPAKLAGIDGELLGVAGIGCGVLLWMLFPLWDRWHPEKPRRGWVKAVGLIALAAFVLLTIMGWVMK
jgi:quinol-cytochrome oxidoreductase complex cytochrome b subunit